MDAALYTSAAVPPLCAGVGSTLQWRGTCPPASKCFRATAGRPGGRKGEVKSNRWMVRASGMPGQHARSASNRKRLFCQLPRHGASEAPNSSESALACYADLPITRACCGTANCIPSPGRPPAAAPPWPAGQRPPARPPAPACTPAIGANVYHTVASGQHRRPCWSTGAEVNPCKSMRLQWTSIPLGNSVGH